MMLKAGFGFERMRQDCERLIPGLVSPSGLLRALGTGPLDLVPPGSPSPLVSSHDLSLPGKKTYLHHLTCSKLTL